MRARLLRAAMAVVTAFLLAFAPPVRAWTPFEKNHPLVERGIEAYEARRFHEALAAFDEAQKALPTSAEVALNRGDALAQLGRFDEARQAFLSAAGTDDPALKSRALYNLGTLEARQGRRKEALSAYRQALRLNPNDEDARHNLETLLRNPNLPPPQPQPQQADGGQPDGGQPDAGQDAGSPDGGRPDGGQEDAGLDGGTDGGADGGPDAGEGDQPGRGDGGMDGGLDGGMDGGAPPVPSSEASADAGSWDAGGQEQTEATGALEDGGVSEVLSEQEAEKLLDSMKQSEKNFQLWRFQKKKPRKPDGKDW